MIFDLEKKIISIKRMVLEIIIENCYMDKLVIKYIFSYSFIFLKKKLDELHADSSPIFVYINKDNIFFQSFYVVFYSK